MNKNSTKKENYNNFWEMYDSIEKMFKWRPQIYTSKEIWSLGTKRLGRIILRGEDVSIWFPKWILEYKDSISRLELIPKPGNITEIIFVFNDI